MHPWHLAVGCACLRILGMCARSRTSVPPPNATSLLRSPPSCVCIMTLLGPAAACLALLEASARTDASREALRAAGIGTAMPAWCHPISDVVKSHEPGPRPPPHYPPGTPGTCCANGICVVGKRRPVQAPAALSTSGVCSPVGIDNALAIVDSAVAKVTCWTAPIPLPTDEGDVDISPLLGVDNKGCAISAHRDRPS